MPLAEKSPFPVVFKKTSVFKKRWAIEQELQLHTEVRVELLKAPPSGEIAGLDENINILEWGLGYETHKVW